MTYNNFGLLMQQRNKYFNYITEHKATVKFVWADIMLSDDHEVKAIMPSNKLAEKISDLIFDHDASKYSQNEFEGYRMHFFPTQDEEGGNKCTDNWKRSVHHHYINNPHHYQHWNLGEQAYPMPFKYIIEMLCDWAAGYYPGSPKKKRVLQFMDYVEAKLSSGLIHGDTQDIIQSWSPILNKLIERKAENNVLLNLTY